VLVFKVLRINEFPHGIAEKKVVLAVTESEAHFVKVGRDIGAKAITQSSTAQDMSGSP
jgi:hypothetical protein